MYVIQIRHLANVDENDKCRKILTVCLDEGMHSTEGLPIIVMYAHELSGIRRAYLWSTKVKWDWCEWWPPDGADAGQDSGRASLASAKLKIYAKLQAVYWPNSQNFYKLCTSSLSFYLCIQSCQLLTLGIAVSWLFIIHFGDETGKAVPVSVSH